MKITWTNDSEVAAGQWTCRTGTDEEGNTFHVNACGEIYTCTTPQGGEGIGWTAEEVLSNAKK